MKLIELPPEDRAQVLKAWCQVATMAANTCRSPTAKQRYPLLKQSHRITRSFGSILRNRITCPDGLLACVRRDKAYSLSQRLGPETGAAGAFMTE